MEAVNLSKAFGATTALVDVSLKAYSGRILTLLGDNGAGKSTLIKILSGVFPPDQASCGFAAIASFSPTPRRRGRWVSPVFQDLAVCELLSVTRNIVLAASRVRASARFSFST